DVVRRRRIVDAQLRQTLERGPWLRSQRGRDLPGGAAPETIFSGPIRDRRRGHQRAIAIGAGSALGGIRDVLANGEGQGADSANDHTRLARATATTTPNTRTAIARSSAADIGQP